MTPITSEFIINNLPHRPDDANKGTMGTLLNISGSYSMAGACILSSLSALKSGVGLLKVALPDSIYPIVASSVYEAVFVPVLSSKNGTIDTRSLDYLLYHANASSAVLLGCGLKCCDETVDFVKEFLSECTSDILIDADGINALAQNIDVLKTTKAKVVVTPHPKEMSRLTGLDVEYILNNREEVATNFAREYGVIVVLKGKNTIITDGDKLYVNPTGNSGMAKGGSGDVLSGIIASLMAQGVALLEAACVGVYIHGLAGDLAAQMFSKTSMLPRDIIECLPQIFKTIEE